MISNKIHLKVVEMLFHVVYYCQNVFWISKIKPWTIVHAFWPKTETFDVVKIGCHQKEHLKRSRLVQISALYHLPVRSYRTTKHDTRFQSKPLTIVHGFRPEIENVDFFKKGCHLKAHLKRSRVALISAS